MKRILFVDDDPNVLQGLQRMLHPLRQEWQMAFAQSGSAALEVLAAEQFDVVVTDLRMPHLDGVQLLTEVRRRYPQTVRITLSGQVTETMALRSVGPAHQCLAKPCDAEALKTVIARACALRDLLADDSLKRVVSRMSSLPSLPDVYLQLIEELRSADAALQRIGGLIAKDMGMTAKMLQLVNSAFFGLPHHISSPAQAVNLLGMETIKALVLSVHVFSQMDEAGVEGFCLHALQMHSLATGVLAKRIAAVEDPVHAADDQILTAGLLHDVGKLVLAANVPDSYAQATVLARDRRVTLCTAEREILGTTHAEVGAYLLGLWGLSDPVVEAAAFHHNPHAYPGTSFSPLTAVHVANVLEHARAAEQTDGTSNELDLEYLARLGLDERVATWREIGRNIGQGGGGR